MNPNYETLCESVDLTDKGLAYCNGNVGQEIQKILPEACPIWLVRSQRNSHEYVHDNTFMLQNDICDDCYGTWTFYQSCNATCENLGYEVEEYRILKERNHNSWDGENCDHENGDFNYIS
eukprot:UN24819